MPALTSPMADATPTRVLHVVDRLDRENAGLSMAALRIAAAQASAGLDVAVTGLLSPGSEMPDGAWRGMAIDPAATPRALVRRVLQMRNRPDCLVHLHGLWNTPTRSCALLGSTPYVVSPHGMLEPMAMAHKRLKKVVYLALCERRILRQARGLHALTPLEETRFSSLGARCARAVIPNPIDPPDAPSARPAPSATRTALFLGRVNRMKGVPELVSAFVALQRRGAADGWRLVVAGWCDDDAVRAELSAMAASAMPGTVAIGAPVFGAEKERLVAQSALFVLPSHHEALPMAALEAMAAGVPVCVSPQCNLDDAVRAGAAMSIRLGTSLEPDLQATLAASACELSEVSRQGRRYVEHRFSYPVVGRRFVSFYRSVMAQKRAETRN